MPLAHDIVLRKGLDEWIESWRNYTLRHPEATADQQWREQQYQKMVAMLDSRKDLTE